MNSYRIENARIIKRTLKAALIDSEETGEKWIPFSVIHVDSEVFKEGDSGTLLIQEWFAKKEGWT